MDTSTKDLRDAFTFNVSTAHALTAGRRPADTRALGWRQHHQRHIDDGPLAGRGFVAYGTAKAALAHYTRLAALDLCPRIRVNAIAPGSILTSALDVVASNEELRTSMEKVTPMRRLGDPEDIAAAAVLSSVSRRQLPDRQDARGRRRPHVPQPRPANPGSVRKQYQRPTVRAAGVWVSSESKAGKDAAELAGLDNPTGIIATNDLDAILNDKPECAVYTAMADNRLPDAYWPRESMLFRP